MAFFQSRSLWVQEFAEKVAVLQFDPSAKTVRLGPELLDDLETALGSIEARPAFRLLVIRSLKPGSFAQSPETLQLRALDFGRWAERGGAIWNRLHRSKIPTLAWVQGACLGPGLELALACRHIFVADADTTLGFSEADLGLIPSWGSVGELVRRIGVENALPLLLAGRRLSAREAVALGLADRVVPDGDPPYGRLIAELGSPRERSRSWRQFFLERTAWGRSFLYRGVERLHRRRLPDDLPGPAAALETLRIFVEQGDDAGRGAAQKAIVRLAASPAFSNLLRLHELRDRAYLRPAKGGRRTVGIVGATPLGMHVLLETVRRGDHAVLRENDEGRLGLAILQLVKMLNVEMKDGRLKGIETQKILGRIRSTVTWKNFEDVDLVLDTRDDDQLEERLIEMDNHVPSDAALVTTSIANRLQEIGERISPGRRLLGLHVPEPRGQYPVAEIRSTSEDDAARQLREWASALGWIPITVADRPGLLLPRLWLPAWNEIVLLLREGARLERLDLALTRFGLGRSLLQTLDTIGLDRIRDCAARVRAEIEPRISIDPFWEEVVERGWRGKANGKGFYRYGRGRPRPNHFLVNWLHQEPGRERMPALSVADQVRYFQNRIVLLTVNEAFRCLEEERVRDSDQLDLAMMLTEWAPHRGGPVRYAEQVGLAKIVAELRSLEPLGLRYAPAPLLLERAAGS